MKKLQTNEPIQAIKNGNNKDVINLISQNVDIHATNDKYRTPLQYDGIEYIIALLCIGGLDDLLRTSNYESTALHTAARFGTSEIVKTLIAAGAKKGIKTH